MEIKYLKKLQNHPTLAGWTNEGYTLDEIEEIESTYLNGTLFPKAYREFLFLAGKHSWIEADIMDWDWMIEEAEERFEQYNIPKIKRPIWITDQLDQCEQFGFIYLDENVDDPSIYNCRPAYVQFGDELVKQRPQGTFSNYINVCTERAKIADESLKKRSQKN